MGSHIWVMNADGSGRVELTAAHPTEAEGQPTWSPDGERIAYTGHLPSGNASSDIWVMNADGSNPMNLTNTSDFGNYDDSPAWSPDGKRIAFHSGRSGDPAVWSMRTDGSDPRLLAEGGDHPTYSPDGSMIAFVRFDGVWVVNADGGTPRRVSDLYDAGFFVGEPDWSSDGTRIVVAVEPRGVGGWTAREIYVIQADASGAQRLTTNSVPDTSPDWRPLPAGQQPLGTTVGLVDPGTGEWHLRNWVGAVVSFYYGNPGDYPFMGDWDCDGVDTPGLYRQSDGYVYLRNSNTQGIADIKFFFGDPGDVPIAGDFNNNGCDTVSLYRPSNQRFYVINALGSEDKGLGAADYSFLFGNPGDQPVVGDWDGDGIAEAGLYRESSGFFYWRDTHTPGIADGEIFFGDPGDRFVAGDWGILDFEETPGVYRASNQTVYFRNTLTQGVADYQFIWPGAGPGWIPVSGHFSTGLPLAGA
jgi:hypothetical protein